MGRLEDGEIERRLADLGGWRREGEEIRKSFVFKDFPTAIEFVRRVGERAETVQHHPDIDIRYNGVELGLSTHSAGGLTHKDFELARDIDSLSHGFPRGPVDGSAGNPLA